MPFFFPDLNLEVYSFVDVVNFLVNFHPDHVEDRHLRLEELLLLNTQVPRKFLITRFENFFTWKKIGVNMYTTQKSNASAPTS